MTTQELKEQLQQDILSVLEGFGIKEAMDENDWMKLQSVVCDIVITNVNRLDK